MCLNEGWKQQLKNSCTRLIDLADKFNFPLPAESKRVEEEYPILIPHYYFKLIDRRKIPEDPIWKQCIPDIKELEKYSFVTEDPLGEESHMPVLRLIHRYEDRVVLLATNRCSMFCRFCFRKRYWKNSAKLQDITNNELDGICSYLSDNPKIREVIVSGGDPLVLETDKLKYILDRLTSIKNIDVIRIATRIPVTLPSRIDRTLVKMLSEYSGLWVVTHFNHPAEITSKSMEACKLIIKSGIPVLNQTVLLKGINDKYEILEGLFRKLIKIQVKPYYLFHVDPAAGVTHFATGIECGLNILKQFRSKLSSIAVPHFAIDLPDGGGKASLQPDYSKDNGFLSVDEKTVIPYY